MSEQSDQSEYTHVRRPENLDHTPGVLLSRDTGDFAIQRMLELTDALFTASQRILEIEKEVYGGNAEGNVLLILSDCGTGCMGCPHPAWRQVRIRSNTKIGSKHYGERFLSKHRITRPSRVSRVQNHAPLHAAVRHALYVIEARSELIDFVSRLRRHLKSKQVPRYHVPVESQAASDEDSRERA